MSVKEIDEVLLYKQERLQFWPCAVVHTEV